MTNDEFRMTKAEGIPNSEPDWPEFLTTDGTDYTDETMRTVFERWFGQGADKVRDKVAMEKSLGSGLNIDR